MNWDVILLLPWLVVFWIMLADLFKAQKPW